MATLSSDMRRLWRFIKLKFRPPLTFDKYQQMTQLTDLGTAAQDSIHPGWLYYALGLAGETGELMEKIKKLFRDNDGVITEEFRRAVAKELGDIDWYKARLADYFDLKSGDIARNNIEKVMDRQQRNMLHGDGDNR